MDYHGACELVRKREFAREEVALLARGFGGVVEVETDFAHGRAGVGDVEGTHGVDKGFVRARVARLVPVCAERKARCGRRKRLREQGGAVQFGGTAYGHEARDARRMCACERVDRLFTVFREMCVRVVDVHRRFLTVCRASLSNRIGRGKKTRAHFFSVWACKRSGGVVT